MSLQFRNVMSDPKNSVRHRTVKHAQLTCFVILVVLNYFFTRSCYKNVNVVTHTKSTQQMCN